MADASFAVEDPSTEDFGQDVVVNVPGGKRAPAVPLGQSGGSHNASQGNAAPQTGGISFDDFFGTKSGSKNAPAMAPATAQQTQGSTGSTASPGDQSQSSAPAAPQGISFDDFFGKPGPDAGPLTNSGDEGYLSGLAKGAATAAIKGVSDIPGFAGNLQNLTDYLVDRGESAVTGEDLGTVQARNAQKRADFAKSSFVPTGEGLPSGAAIAAPVLAKAGDYRADTELGRLGQAGVEGAISAFAPGGIGSPTGAAIPGALSLAAKQAPMFAAQTGIGQVATDVTGDPLLGAAAGMVGGSALGATGQMAAKVGSPMVAALPDSNIPLIGNVPGNMRERLAGRQIAASATDPQGLRDTLNGTGAQTSTPVVPGSKPTLGQLSGDMGILQAERAARTDDVSPFNEREAQQNSARRNQIAAQASANADAMRVPAAFEQQRADLDRATQGDVAAETARKAALRGQVEAQSPAGADVMRAPQTFRDRLNHIEKATQQAVEALTQRAKDAAGTLGRGATPEARGSAIRTAIEAAKKVASAMKTRLYDAVDPEDKLNLVFSPVRDAADRIAQSIDPLDEAPTGREASILADVRERPDVQPFKSLRALDRRVTTAMKEARRAGDDTVHRRLTILKGAVQSAIDDGVENQVAYEKAAVARGEIEPGDTIASRLSHAFGSGPASDRQAYPGAMAAGAGAANAGNVGSRSLDDAGAVRAESAPGGQSRPGSSRQGLSGEERSGAALGVPLPPAGSAPLRLIKFLASRGGLRPDSELRGIFAGENPFVPGIGKLVRKGGMSLDAAREAATEAGYIFDPGSESRGPLETDVNDLLDKIASDHQGDHQFPIGEQSDAYRHAMELRQSESTLRAELKGSGVNPNDVPRRVMNAAVDMITSGEEPNPHIAYERAVMQNSDSFGNEAGERLAQTGPIYGHDFSDDAYGAPDREFAPPADEEGHAGAGGPAGRGRGQSRPGGADDRAEGEGRNAQPPLTPNFDQAAAGRLGTAKDFFKNKFAPTYKEGPVAKILAGPFSGKYDVLDSAVPSKAVLKDDRGYETAKAFIKASDSSPDAIGAMADHVLDDLRHGLLPIGTVSPSKFAKWKSDYAGVLRAIDEHVPGFSSRFDSAAHATEAMMEAGRLREEGLSDFQKSAAGQFLGSAGKNDPVEVENAVGKILSDRAAGPTRMEALVTAASRDPAAVEGLKKAGVDWMLKNLSDKDGNLDAGKFQKFVSANRVALQKLYGSPGLGIFASVGHELSKMEALPASAAREGALSDFQKNAAGQFLGNLGKNDPSEVEAAVGKILTDKAAGPTRMEALVKAASDDPEAVAGLKKAAVDWMMKRFSTTAEAGTSEEKLLSSAGLQKFVSDNKAAIEKLFGSDTAMLESVAHDLERANRPISATRIGGSPGTAHDAKPMFSEGQKKLAGHTSMMVALIEGVHLGYEHGGLKGAALAGGAGAASYLMGTLRHAGLNKVDALVRDALLNPERARAYLSKAPASADSGRFLGLASSIRRQLIGTPINLRNAAQARGR
jgi:hypothetical protein